MITVHHLTNSHSHVVLWLMEELGLPHEMVLHRREPNGRSPESLRTVHPAAYSPIRGGPWKTGRWAAAA